MDPETPEFWNDMYDQERYPPSVEASSFLRAHMDMLPPGTALDVGCGVGRNAVFLAEAGYEVDAIDFSGEALERARDLAAARDVAVDWIETDLRAFDYAGSEYDVVLVSYHHDLDALRRIKDGLADGGVLVYEHHLRSTEPVDRGPTEDHVDGAERYRFRSQELLHACLDLTVLQYEERTRETPDGDRAAVAGLVARNTRGGTQSYPPVTVD